MSLNERISLIRDPYRVFKFFDHRHLLDWLPDKAYLKLAFRMKMGYPLDLKDPKTFNQKLQWLKLYDRDPLYTTLVDKYAVRQWVADKVGEEYLIPLVGGPWERAEDIDFDALPDQFVLKCNHDSGGVIVCQDKSSFDLEGARAKLSHALSRNYYMNSREWPYKDVKPRVLAEKYMGDENGRLPDYKFYYFNGRLGFILVTEDREDPAVPTKYNYFDPDFQPLPFYRCGPHSQLLPERPEKLEEMLDVSACLAQGMPHVRVDLYWAKNRIWFGEMTLYGSSGMASYDPPEWDYTIGSWLELPERRGRG